MDFKDMASGGIVLLLGIVGWFLRSKDVTQEKQISALWEKHDEDSKALQDLKERIAREHYVKGELDARFQRLEDAFKAGFHDLGAKIDKLANAMISHMQKERK